MINYERSVRNSNTIVENSPGKYLANEKILVAPIYRERGNFLLGFNVVALELAADHLFELTASNFSF